MRVNPACESGNIIWYYPTGLLRAQFTHEIASQEFRVCLLINKATSTEDNSELRRIDGKLVDDTRGEAIDGTLHLLTKGWWKSINNKINGKKHLNL